MANQAESDTVHSSTRAGFSTVKLAEIVEINYELASPIECSLLNRGINDVYLISSLEQKHILRVARANRPEATFDEAAYRFEIDLLNFLREKELTVAYPLVRRDKDTLGLIYAPEGACYYSLFTFAQGEIPASLDKAQAYILGGTLARLHLAANDFSSPHPRFHLDAAFLIDEPLRRLRKLPKLAKEDMEFLENICVSLRETLLNLPRQNDEYGVIHGDFWWNNVHFADENVTLFDFDFCGYGWRAYDISALNGTAIAFGSSLSNEVVDALLTGYQSVRKLSDPELAAIPAFEQIRIMWGFGLWASAVPVMGTEWFFEIFNQVFPNLKKWVQDKECPVVRDGQ